MSVLCVGISQFERPIQNSSLIPYSCEKSIDEGAKSGKIINISSTPMITSLVLVSESALPSFDGSVSFLNRDSGSSAGVFSGAFWIFLFFS